MNIYLKRMIYETCSTVKIVLRSVCNLALSHYITLLHDSSNESLNERYFLLNFSYFSHLFFSSIYVIVFIRLANHNITTAKDGHHEKN